MLIVTSTYDGYWKNYFYIFSLTNHCSFVKSTRKLLSFPSTFKHLKTKLPLLYGLSRTLAWISCAALEKKHSTSQNTSHITNIFSLQAVADPDRFGDLCRLLLKEYKIFQGFGVILLLKQDTHALMSLVSFE